MIGAVPLRYPIRNLGRRPARTFLTVAGLSLIVGLIVFLVAFGRSFGNAMRIPGDPRTLVVVSKRAQSFEFSAIAPSELDAMANEVSDLLATDPGGAPAFAREVYHFTNVRLSLDPSGKPRRALLHGIVPGQAERFIPGFRLVEGSMPAPGGNEVLAGRNAADRLGVPAGMLAPGARIAFRDQTFTVTGVYAAPGTLYENWMLTWPDDIRFAINRTDYSFARMKVREGVDLAALARRLNEDERYQVRALPETEYFADFVEGFAGFRRFSVLLAAVLAVAGVLTGMNTLHNAVLGRVREIGTLRVLGFGKGQVLAAFLVEALLMCGAAGLLGCGLGRLASGVPMRVPVAATFPVVVDGPALAAGFSAALLIGVLGLAFPMMRALRMPAVEAVRA